MPFPRLVPCLDCRDGRVVKGVQFRGLRDAGDPAQLAARYAAAGADEIVLLDVAATVAGRGHAAATVAAVRAVLPIPLTVGGGVRTVDDAARLLDAGADKVAVNSAALARPELLGELAARFGAQCVVIAIDAARSEGDVYEALSHAGGARTGRDAIAWARAAVEAGAGEVLLTSVDRDGTGAGYDLALLRAVAASVTAPVVASGGARGAADLAAAFAAGADAALLASALHDGAWTVDGLKEALSGMGVEVRR
ncbi:MAG: imidazole glycerol phosphate synthase subunit HisF [Phycisphaerales bacterium]|jgi:cyclase|nr:imidazole glycerol phosphate synthase subunit HisF [Phycisphaerales bacterium]